MIFNPIRPDRALDFERVIGRIYDALAMSKDPARRQQAAGWKVFRATEPGPNNTTLYIFAMDPAVKGADYTVSKVLAEAFPIAEVQTIWTLYTAAFASPPSLVNLHLVQDFGAPVKLPVREVAPPAAPAVPAPSAPGAPSTTPAAPSTTPAPTPGTGTTPVPPVVTQ
jgi:hypothetical protein